MKYAVLGSDSFSGGHFCRFLREHGDDVIPLGRRYDINRDLDDIGRILHLEQPHYVVNFIAKGLVAESWREPAEWVRTNVLAQTQLVEILRFLPIIRYVHVSTPEVYGSGAHSEDSPFRPSTPYAVTKAAMEMMLMAYHHAYRFPVVFTRSGNVYGPGQKRRIIPLAIEAAKNGAVLKLHGLGESKRSFIHILDVCSATKLVAEHGRNGHAYNIATERFTSILDLVRMIGCKYESVPDRLGKDDSYIISSQKIRTDLMWSDTITLEKGLKELWDEK